MRTFAKHAARLSMGISTSVLALAVAAPAMAQQAPAQTGAKDTAEIIVTAQKRPEKLQEIPVAAAVLSQAAVAQAHVVDLSDINRVVPSVELKGTFNGRVPYGIRGISTNANEGAIGLTSGVSIQVDGVPVPADSFAVNTITDVAQLEVLKGPQATLGGRTASAGVINFVTVAPSTTPQYAVNALTTNDGEWHIDGRAAGPITDKVSYSLTGYYQRTPYPITNITTGVKSRAESYGTRAKLKFELSDNLDLQVMGHYAMSKSKGANFIVQYWTPGSFFFAPPVGLDAATMYPGYTIGYGNTKLSTHTTMVSRYEDKDTSAVLNWRLGDLTLTSTTAYSHEGQYQTQDTFLGNDPNWALKFETFLNAIGQLPSSMVLPYSNLQSAQGYVSQTSQEFKLATDAKKPLSALVGLFYSDMTVNQYVLRAWTLNPLAKNNISTTKNYSIYGRATAHVNDRLTFVGGLRYNWDKIGWNVAQYFNPAAGQYGSGGFGQGGYTWNLSDSSGALVGDAAIQFKPTRDIMTYASYTRGYKPKAFNTVHDWSIAPGNTTAAGLAEIATFAKAVAQEHIDSFEVGLKSTLLDRHLTFNLAAFYTNYSGYQAQIFDTSKLVGVLILANAGARTQGVEADLNYVKGNTRASLSAALIDAKFTNFKGAVCWPTQTTAQGCDASGTQDLSGKPMPASPKLKVNAQIVQTIPFEKFNLIAGTNLSYRSGSYLQANQNPQTFQSAFGLMDLSLGFQTKDEKATLTFFVNNVTDRFYLTNAEDFFAGATTGNLVIGQPARDSSRYFGARVGINF